MAIFSSFLFGTALYYLFHYFPVVSILLFVAASIWAIIKKKPALLPVILLGVFYAVVRHVPSPDPGGIANRELRITGNFIQRASSEKNGLKTFSVDTAYDEDTGEELEELHGEEVNVPADIDAVYEEGYELLIRTGKDRTRQDPGWTGRARLYGTILGATETAAVPQSIPDRFNKYRNDLNRYFLGRFKPDSAALIASVTTGEMAFLSSQLRDAFNTTGLAHILSISGSHFGLFSVVLFSFFLFCLKLIPHRIFQRMSLYISPSQASAILTIPFIVMYLGISGGGPPALRSFLMINLFLIGLLIGRKGFWLNSLLFAAFVIVLWNPGALLELSFQLSFLAVLFIGFSFERGDDTGEDKGYGKKGIVFLKNSFKFTAAASLGTAPLVVHYFHYFSVVSPLSNLIAAPLIGLVLVPLSLISSFSFLVSGHYVFAPFVAASADASVSLVTLLSLIPFADVKIPALPPATTILFYAGCAAYAVSGKRKIILVVFSIPFVFAAVFGGLEKKALAVTFLDVGQGDAAVVELPDGRIIAVDTGRTGRETAAYLSYIGKRDVDALVLTHCHPDHSGGLEYLTGRLRVKEIWDSGRIVYPEGVNIVPRRRTLERGDTVEGRGYRITVLHPYKGFNTLLGNDYEDENNSSLVLNVSGKRSSFLMSGDIEDEAETDMTHLNGWLAADVIKVPHHGSRTSLNRGFLAEVSPSIAVISVGRDNTFGHPSPDVLIEYSPTKMMRTDRDGAVKIIETDKGLSVKTWRDFVFESTDGIDIGKELRNIRRLFAAW